MPLQPTARHSIGETPRTLATSIKWLLDHRNSMGTWGSQDYGEELDTFITTRHVAMTLIELGFAIDSEFLKPAIDYLAKLKAKDIDPYWRIELLALAPEYRSIVLRDAEAGMRRLRNDRSNLPQRLWPLPYFLLRFYSSHEELRPQLSFDLNELLEITLDGFSPVTGCRDDASLTAMAAAELSRHDFERKSEILRQMIAYLEGRRTYFSLPYRRPGFEPNLVRDFYLTHCLTRYPEFYRRSLSRKLRMHIQSMMESAYRLADSHRWSGVPAYGGRVGGIISPTAFGVRALVSYNSVQGNDFRRDVLADTLDLVLTDQFARIYSRPLAPMEFVGGEASDSGLGQPDSSLNDQSAFPITAPTVIRPKATDEPTELSKLAELDDWLVDFRDSILTVDKSLKEQTRHEGIMLAELVRRQLLSPTRDRGDIRVALARLTDIALEAAGKPPLRKVMERIDSLNEIRENTDL